MRRPVLAALILATGMGTAAAAEGDAPAQGGTGGVLLHGTVTVEGAWPKVGIYLEVDTGAGPKPLVRVAKDGSFSYRHPLQPGTEVTLTPYNSTALNTPEPTFLTGHMRTRVKPDDKVEVHLTARRILTREISVLDQSGKPAANIGIGVEAAIPLGPEPGAPAWKNYVSFRTDGEGKLPFKYVEIEGGSYDLTVNTVDSGGDKYLGEASLSGRQLMNKDEPLSLEVQRLPVWLEVQFRWDPDRGNLPFRPDVGSAIEAHRVWASGATGRKDAVLSPEGLARFYGLKPGNYTIELSDLGRRLYSISGGSEKVTIPKDAKLPVRHTVTLLPAGKTSVAGKVIDRATGKPVAGATVAAEGEGTIETGPDGAFKFEGVSGANLKLRVHHANYCGFEGTYPLASGKDDAFNLDVRLAPLPTLRVLAADRDSGKGVPGCNVFARGELIDAKAVTAEDGSCLLRLPEGRYQLLVRRPGTPAEGDAAGARSASKAMVYAGETAVPKDGGELRIELPAVVAVRAAVNGLGPRGQGRGPGFCLVRPKDNLIMAGVPLDVQGEGVAYVGAGTYRLVVIAEEERSGADGGEVQALAPMTGPVKIEVRQWRKLTLTGDARMLLGDPIQDEQPPGK